MVNHWRRATEEEKERRAAEFALLRKSGATLQEIGDIASLTRQRIGQILVEYGYSDVTRDIGFDPKRVLAAYSSTKYVKEIAADCGQDAKRVGKALKALGLTTKPTSVTDASLLEHLKKLAVEFGSTPTREQIDLAGPPNTSSYQAHFGTLSSACRLAGLQPRLPGRPIMFHMKHSDIDEGV